MHALRIPLTGIFVGGGAVVLLSLIAHHAKKPFSALLQATLAVLLVKFLVSPHTRAPAYLAVGFQGLLAALLLGSPLPRWFCLPVFMVIAMVESALQSVLISTLIFGKQLWVAIDHTALALASELGINKNYAADFSLHVILFYTGVYAFWGLALSFFAWHLPRWLEQKRGSILNAFSQLEEGEASGPKMPDRHKKKFRLLAFVLVLAFVSGSFLFAYSREDAWQKALFSVLRTLAVVLGYFYLLIPLLKWGMDKLADRFAANSRFRSVMKELPELRRLVMPAWQLSRNYPRWKRLPVFFTNLIILSLYRNE